MKKLFLAQILLLFFCQLFASDKISFIACGDASALFTGGYKGALSSGGIMADKYSRDIKIEYVSIPASAPVLADKLSKSYIEGAKGAIVFLNGDISNPDLCRKIKELTSRGFPIGLAGGRIAGASANFSVQTDSKKAVSILDSEIKSLGGSQKIPLLCVFKEGAAPEVISKEQLAVFEKNHNILKKVSTSMYSLYASENAVEIMRFDTYGTVLFDASVLADLSPLKSDTDRRFTISLGGAPYLLFYLKNGSLSACIMDDYYGFGYCLMRDICDNIYGAGASKQSTLLAPLIFRSSEYSQFAKLWKDWL